MSDLIAWLTAQVDEDERVALASSPGPWCLNAEGDEVWAVDDELVAEVHALSSNQLRATAAHIALYDPARALREVEAKRVIIAHTALTMALESKEPAGRAVIRGALAAYRVAWRHMVRVYADRPGYRDEWAA
jgi:hypothetical protein